MIPRSDYSPDDDHPWHDFVTWLMMVLGLLGMALSNYLGWR